MPDLPERISPQVVWLTPTKPSFTFDCINMQCAHCARVDFFPGDEMRTRAAGFLGAGRGFWSGIALVLLSTTAGMAQAREGIRLGATQAALLVWIAQEKNLFAKHGLNAEPSMFSSGIAAADALVKGELDLATSSDFAFMSKVLAHSDLRALASIGVIRTARLIGRKDRQIAEAGDLPGKKIGITRNTISEFFLTRYLALHGIDISSATIVDLKPQQIAHGLVTGTLDAGLSWDPFITDAEGELKDNAIVLPGQVEQSFFFLLIARKEWTEKHPGEVKSLLNALIEAETFAANDADQAKQIIQKKFGYRPDVIDVTWPQHSLHVSLPQTLVFNLEVQANWRLKKNIAPANKMPEFLDFIMTEPLAALRPSSIGIVK
jgi:ABC-type nitrate/sulfonate/bicarbonate transport system substrate-binding protein